jgi:hypothetical protein
MKTRIAMMCLMVMLIGQSVYAMTGREIMEKTDALAEPQTSMMTILMKIYKGDRVEEKEFTLQAKQYPNDEDKALISFIRPTQITLLTHAYKDKEDDQWLKLSSGKIKRIASSEKGQPFVNSHFYYEDLSSIEIDDYKYELLGEEKAVGEDCYQVEGVKQVGEKVYDKVIFYVRKSDYFVLRIDFYRDGAFHKFLENYDIKEINGILTPYRVKMELSDGKGKTELELKELKYNAPIADTTFNKESMR